MMDEIKMHFDGSRNEFERNVTDFFGRKIKEEIYDPFRLELVALEQAFDEAHTEQQVIKNLLDALRVIV